MALPWVKLHVGLIDNDAFKRLSRGAKLTFFCSLSLAGKQDLDGVLALRTGPMTPSEIGYYTGLSKAQQTECLDELVTAGFLIRGLDSAWAVAKWKEKAGDVSTTRTRAYRKRHSDVPGTFPERECDAVDKEEEEDKDNWASLRSAALAFGEWPRAERLADLSAIFLRRFANCRSDEAIKKHRPAYATALASFRSRGATIGQAWEACEEAVAASGGVPLFGASAKNALSFLPSRPSSSGRREVNYEDLS
jgi:hypothetical protein